MRQAIAAQLPGRAVTLKWPNDVLVGEKDGGPARKISGILAEVLPSDPMAVVVGAGVNTTMETVDLPVPTATAPEPDSGAPALPRTRLDIRADVAPRQADGVSAPEGWNGRLDIRNTDSGPLADDRLPLIRDNVQTAYIYLGILALDAFVYMAALNATGGPGNSTLVMSQYLFRTAFEKGQFGLASAMGVVLAVITLLFAALVFLVNRLTGGKDDGGRS